MWHITLGKSHINNLKKLEKKKEQKSNIGKQNKTRNAAKH